jgi:predicted O-methyltransferase YrrM
VARVRSSSSARWAATARSGSPGDCRLTGAWSRSSSTPPTPRSRANIARAELDHLVEQRIGPAIETLPQLVAEGDGPFDLIFIDADKVSYPDYLPWTLKLSAPGTLIIADNLVRGGAVIDTENDDPSVGGSRRFTELLAAEPRVSATLIQTVGSKGYDGFALGLVDA